MLAPELQDLLDATRVGFAALDVAPPIQERALDNLQRWITEPMYSSYLAQVQAYRIGEQVCILALGGRQRSRFIPTYPRQLPVPSVRYTPHRDHPVVGRG